MAIHEVLLLGNEALRRKSSEIDIDVSRVKIEEYINDLSDTLHHLQSIHKIGRALAGPQIGLHKRIVFMNNGNRRIVMINPVITERSEEQFEVWDSCYSAEVAFFGKTIRSRQITVEYDDEKLTARVETFEDELSELFQHEIDHLEGTLFTDRIVDNQIVMRSEWERLFGCQ